MLAVADDDYRVVIDEEGLDWRDLPEHDVNRLLVEFADMLEPIADGRHVVFMDVAYNVECWQSITFVDLPYTSDPRILRDARLRLARLLDKCRVIEPQECDIPRTVRLAGQNSGEPSWGMSHALARAESGRTMCCLVVRTKYQLSGWVTVEREEGEVGIFLLCDAPSVTGFWREVLVRDAVPTNDFFSLTGLAFPTLLFAPSLSFFLNLLAVVGVR